MSALDQLEIRNKDYMDLLRYSLTRRGRYVAHLYLTYMKYSLLCRKFASAQFVETPPSHDIDGKHFDDQYVSVSEDDLDKNDDLYAIYRGAADRVKGI